MLNLLILCVGVIILIIYGSYIIYIYIMTLMLSICAIFFFTSGVIYFKDYSLFGYVSVVPPSQIIQLIVIDLLWMMIIIQHPIARNKLFHFIKGTNETVQIIQV